jgi:HEAT repeat protein
MRGFYAPSVTARYLTLLTLALLGTLGKLDELIVAQDIEDALSGERRWDLAMCAGLVTEWLRHQGQLTGETPLKLFTAPLKEQSPVARAIGVAALCLLGIVGDQDESELTALLSGAVGDRSPLVAGSALAALAALELTDRVTQPLPERELLAALQTTNPLSVRLIAVVALTLLADARHIGTPLLAESLGRMVGQGGGGDPSAIVRTMAVVALAILGSEDRGKQQARLLAQLTGALSDRSWWVKVSAAVGWVTAAEGPAPRQVGEVLGAQQGIWVRFSTAALLAAEYDQRELQRMLLKLSAKDSKPSEVLAQSLRRLRRPGRHDPLRGALWVQSVSTRRRAAVALAALDGLRVVLGESDETVRDVAVLALGMLSLVQLHQRAPLGEWRLLGWLRAQLRRLSTQEATIRDLATQLRKLSDRLSRSERVQRILQRVRWAEQLAPPDSQVARLLRPDTHWLVASAAAIELGLFGSYDSLESEHAQRVADALCDARPHGQQWVRTAALLVLYTPLLNGYEPRWSQVDARQVERELLTQLGASPVWQTIRHWLSGLLPMRGLAETTYARTAWLRAVAAWLQGALASSSETARGHLSVPHLFALACDDESAAVRWAAVHALRQLKDVVSTGQLQKVLKDRSARVRGAAIGALDARGQQVPAEVFEAVLDDPDWSVRVEAVAALRKRQAVAGLQRALRDLSPAVRAAAAAALASEARRARGDPLVAAFGDIDAYLMALGVPADLTGSGTAPRDAVDAVTALRELGQHVPPSWAAAALDRSSNTPFQVTYAVRWLGWSDLVLARLDEGLRSPSWRVRAVTTVVLGMLNVPRAEASLQRALNDDRATVRDLALGMLARRSAGISGSDRLKDQQNFLLDVLFVLGQDLQTAIVSAVQELTEGVDNAALGSAAAAVAALLKPSVSPEMLDRLEALLGAPGWAVRVRAAVALSNVQQAAPERAVRRMLGLFRELGNSSDLDEETKTQLIALDDALRQVLRPATPSAATNS